MAFLSFLKDLKIEEAPVKTQSIRREAKDKSPAEDFMGIRIWKDGSVYPSKSLVEVLNLEYVKVGINVIPVTKDGQPVMETKDGVETQKTKRKYMYPENTGNGLDVVDSQEWTQYPQNQPRILLVGVTPKTESKVDLFAATRYDDEGNPSASVLTQGADTFGKETLLPSIKEVYNMEPNEEGFIDVAVVTEENLAAISRNGIFLLPKKIVRGANAGKSDYERREGIALYPLVPELILRPVENPEQSVFETPAEETTA